MESFNLEEVAELYFSQKLNNKWNKLRKKLELSFTNSPYVLNLMINNKFFLLDDGYCDDESFKFLNKHVEKFFEIRSIKAELIWSWHDDKDLYYVKFLTNF